MNRTRAQLPYARALYYFGANGESAVLPGWMRSMIGNLATCVIPVVVSISAVPIVFLALVHAITLRSAGRRKP